VRYSLSLFRAHLGLLSCSCTLAIERWADLEEVESAEPSGLAYVFASMRHHGTLRLAPPHLCVGRRACVLPACVCACLALTTPYAARCTQAGTAKNYMVRLLFTVCTLIEI
jgi:hypothetical protein